MRTTIDIDDDVLSAARDLARVERKTIGEIISDLARKALTTPDVPEFDESSQEPPSDWPTFPRRDGGRIVTSEMVRKIQEQIDLEDAMPFDHTTGEVRQLHTKVPRKRKTGRGARRRKSAK